MSKQVTVRPTQKEHFDHWSDLYHGYARFYKVPMNDEILSTTWNWIMDENHEVEGYLAFLGDDPVPRGLAHVRTMPSPLRGIELGFLDDLFVDPDYRGNKIGEALFDYLRDLAKTRNWSKIRWITADDNYRARGLYDKLSKKTMWNLYEMEI